MLRSMTPAIIALALAASTAVAGPVSNPLTPSETWTDLAPNVIGDAVPLDGSDLFSIEAPKRAHDAAIVPVRIVQALASGETIKRLTLVVDENPAPVVAEFEFGPSMGHIDLETRVRVDRYSNFRVIAETADGATYMDGRFIKASGGCSAPALKGMADAIATAGQMRLKVFDAKATQPAVSSGRQQAQVMIRHPNYSGMQRNQITHLFIPAFFIHEMEVYQGDEMLFRMEGGISISEDPVFRFSYTPNGASKLRVRAVDTDGNVFEQTFDPAGQAT